MNSYARILVTPNNVWNPGLFKAEHRTSTRTSEPLKRCKKRFQNDKWLCLKPNYIYTRSNTETVRTVIRLNRVTVQVIRWQLACWLIGWWLYDCRFQWRRIWRAESARSWGQHVWPGIWCEEQKLQVLLGEITMGEGELEWEKINRGAEKECVGTNREERRVQLISRIPH